MKTQQRCMNSKCRAPLLSAFEREQGFCTKCQSKLSDEEMEAIRRRKSPKKADTIKETRKPKAMSPRKGHTNRDHKPKNTDVIKETQRVIKMSPGIEAAFSGPNTERLCTRIPVLALRVVEERLESLKLTPSAYIRNLIQGDMKQ